MLGECGWVLVSECNVERVTQWVSLALVFLCGFKVRMPRGERAGNRRAMMPGKAWDWS